MGVENYIPEGWSITYLHEVANYISRGITPKYSETGSFYVLNQRCIRDKKVSMFNARFHNITAKNVSDDKRLKFGDILICSTGVGTLGRVAQYRLENLTATVDSHVTIVRPNDSVFKPFLGHLLIQKERDIELLAEGTTGQTELPRTSLGLLQIKLPPIQEQKAISNVLTAFDNKIELLQAQNRTLETMAQTIFKEWFGKYQIGGELPEGWRVGKFGEVIEFINGYAFKSKDLSKEPIENSYKVFKMGDIKKGGGFNPGKTKGYFSRSLSLKLDKYILKNGDLLMSMTDMKDAISLLGHTALMIYDDEYIVNQRVGLIRANNNLNIEYPYLYILTNNEDFIARIRAGANSGVQVNLSTQGIKETEFIIADKETNKAFNDLVMPLFDKIKSNTLMIKNLAKTRDTLLPKLMSGQVRVSNLKQTIDA